MASAEIFRYKDEDDEKLIIRDRRTYLKVSMPDGPFVFMDPADVVRLRDALTGVIMDRGWTS
jgi:hypothetical protein